MSHNIILSLLMCSINPFDFSGTTGPDLSTTDNSMILEFVANKNSKTDQGFSCTAICVVPTTTTTSTTSTTSTSPKPTTTAKVTTTSSITPKSTTTSKTSTSTTPKPTTTTTFTTTPQPTTTEPVPVSCGDMNISPGKRVPFQSPGYPSKYKKKSKCTWEFTCENPDGKHP